MKNLFWGNVYNRRIKERIGFQVGNKIFATPRSAAKSHAWALICNRYIDESCHEDRLSAVRRVGELSCSCGDPNEDLYPMELCELHDRYIGYFARMHRKLTARILKANGF